MNPPPFGLSWRCGVVMVAVSAPALADVRTWTDPVGDAVLRRTDEGQTAPLLPDANRPDIISTSICGWSPTNPTMNPYVGQVVPAAGAHIFKLDVVLNGLINPPGPIQFPDQPALYGPNPLYGYIDLDVDQDIDTGGEQPGGRFNYLEQIARFGSVPIGPLADRAARGRSDVDYDFYSAPFYERSGADFTLTFCGCTTVSVIPKDGNPDAIFEAGETWIVRGTFFQRSAGYQCASFAFGGFKAGLYEPVVDLRFQHNASTNRTTVTLVFPLTMRGAALLTGQPEQPWDFTYGNGNHFSIFEALSDVVTAVDEGAAVDECTILAANWAGRNPANFLNILNWNATALFATTYAEHPFGASYVWTDLGFNQITGDMNGDGRADSTDRALIQSYIAATDGSPDDADGIANNSVTLPQFAFNYNVHDVNGDGVVDAADIGFISPDCPADWDMLNGLNTADFFAFLNDFFAGHADFNGDGQTDSADFMAFVSAFFAGCP